MYLPRYYSDLDDFIKPNKVLVIFGPRQVGKTTMVKHYLESTSFKYRMDSGDNLQTRELLSVSDIENLKEYAAGYDLLVIDEAQRIENIGLSLKILVDQIPGIRIIATGSSSFELAGQVGEPLTGRKTTLTLYPLSQLELAEIYNPQELKSRLERWLIYGGYPEVVTAETDSERRAIITEMMNSYLLKDILELEKIKSAKILLDLLKLLAFQLGNLVSLSELASALGIDYKTVARYIDLLEKSFVIYNLRGFSRNLRKEITKKSKYYFYDTGIRNAIIANFNPLDLRNDIGALWENWLVIERLKKQAYTQIFSNNYFWRTWTQQKVDFVEEHGGQLYGYEFKWNEKTAAPPSEWLKTYPGAKFQVINRKNYFGFIC